MDQRKANVVARELGERLGCWKPVCVHHSLLQGLAKPPVWPVPKDKEREVLSSTKMSKSKPETCIYIYDRPDEIRQKMAKAFCPEKIVEYNPVMEVCRLIIFRDNRTFKVERPSKFGGPLAFNSLEELQKTYAEGKLHPADLKNAVAEELARILEPVRRYFDTNREAAECLEATRKFRVTR